MDIAVIVRLATFQVVRSKLLAYLLPVFVLAAQTPPPRNGAISGRLSNAVTGSPVRKARVVLSAAGQGRGARTVTSDVNGRYAIAAVPPGEYRLSIQRDGFNPVSFGAEGPRRAGKVLSLGPGQAIEGLNFALQPLGVITGHVLDEEGEPAEGVTVQALRQDLGRGAGQYVSVATASSNDQGEYRLFGLPPGRFYVMTQQRPRRAATPGEGEVVYAPVYYPGTPELASAAALNVAAGGEAREIDLRVARSSAVVVRGTVASVAGGEQKSIVVQIARKDRAFVGFGSRFQGGFNGPSGQFEFRGLTPGSYVVIGSLQSGDTVLYGRQDIEVGATDIDDLRLTLSRGLDITGKVRFTGAPSQGAQITRVTLTRAEPYGTSVAVGPVEEDSFVLKAVSPGSWRVAVSLRSPDAFIQSIRLGEQDGLAGDVQVRPDSQDALNIMIGLKGGTVEGVVRSAAGPAGAIEGATVLMVPTGDRSAVDSYCKTAVADREGRYRIRGIAPGNYRIFGFDNMEPFAFRDPDFLRSLEGKGRQITVGSDGILAEDLTPSDHP